MACYKDKLALNNADSTIGFPVDNIIIFYLNVNKN